MNFWRKNVGIFITFEGRYFLRLRTGLCRAINAVSVVAFFTSSRTKQRTMSQNSLSLGDESIHPTQSVEYVFETETQKELPETQESVTNFDILFEFGDFI